jgi:hypothetical protein
MADLPTFSDEILAHFAVHDVPSALKLVDANLLANLYDIASKFGAISDGEYCLRIDEFGIYAPLDPTKGTIKILHAFSQEKEFYYFSYGRADSLILPTVYWHRAITPERVTQSIALFDLWLETHGLVDDDTHERAPMVRLAEVGMRIPTEWYFRKRHVADVPSGYRAEKLTEFFDEPEKVRILEYGLGWKYLCHLRDYDILRAHCGLQQRERLSRFPSPEEKFFWD